MTDVGFTAELEKPLIERAQRCSRTRCRNLSALTLTDAGGNAIALNETFAGNTTAYTAAVGSDVAGVKVTPTTADTGVLPTGRERHVPRADDQGGAAGRQGYRQHSC